MFGPSKFTSTSLRAQAPVPEKPPTKKKENKNNPDMTAAWFLAVASVWSRHTWFRTPVRDSSAICFPPEKSHGDTCLNFAGYASVIPPRVWNVRYGSVYVREGGTRNPASLSVHAQEGDVAWMWVDCADLCLLTGPLNFELVLLFLHFLVLFWGTHYSSRSIFNLKIFRVWLSCLW